MVIDFEKIAEAHLEGFKGDRVNLILVTMWMTR